MKKTKLVHTKQGKIRQIFELLIGRGYNSDDYIYVYSTIFGDHFFRHISTNDYIEITEDRK